MELLAALFFYLIFTSFALIGLSITSRLISNKILSYVAAKPAGLILFGYAVWLLSSFKILDYQNHRLILGLFAIASLGGIYLARNFFIEPISNSSEEEEPINSYKKSKKFKRHQRRIKPAKKEWPLYKKILAAEGITVAIYLLYLLLRSTNAAINGTERFMDMALLSAAGKTHFFPFIDPWYAGKAVNYYYYGSYLISLASNVGRLPYALTYNFTLGLLLSQCMFMASALTFTITKSKKFAILSAALITVSGTLFYAGCSINAWFEGVGRVCSYASSTRLYTPSYIINEIPSYSFTVGDLHAHLLALPFFIFGLILLYELAISQKPKLALFLLLALSLATSGMINAWDAITLFSLLAVIIIIKIYQIVRGKEFSRLIQISSAKWSLGGIISGAGVILLMLPYLKNFQSPVLGIGFIPLYVKLHNLKDVQYPTPLLAEIGMWGVFFAGIILAVCVMRKRIYNYLFVCASIVVALGIILGVELFFIKDIYSIANPPFFRANTTFKFGFHAWTLLSVSFCVFMSFLFNREENKTSKSAKRLAVFITAIVVLGGVIYPYQAIKQFYLTEYNIAKEKTLNGATWMKDGTIDDWEMVNFINENFPERKVIAEAVGDSYSTFSRITTFTGMITPMGWQSHEWTWRFQGKEAEKAPPGQPVETGWGAVSQVALDIRQLYNTVEYDEAKKIIEQYGISYVYIGSMEKTAYPDLQEEKFHQLGDIIFESGDSKIFAVK